MRKKFCYFFTVALILLEYANAFGQSSQYRFSKLDIHNGLSHNQVDCIFKDSEGFVWFGTASGLNRFDGSTVKVFKHDPNNAKSVLDDFINNIFEGPDKKLWVITRSGYCFYDYETDQFNSDKSSVLAPLKLPAYPIISKVVRNGNGDFWFLCPDSGVYKYNSLTKQTKRYYHSVKSNPSLYSSDITDITQDSNGHIWLVYRGGVIEMLDTKKNKITYQTDVFSKLIKDQNGYYSLTVDRDNDLWFYRPNEGVGVYYYNRKTGALRHIDKESPGMGLKSNIISSIVQADDGLIWIGTDHGGINILNKSGFSFTYLQSREDDAKSLNQNSVWLYKDDLGIIWAGTFKEGVSYYHKNIIRFPLYRHFASDAGSLPFEDVDTFVEDNSGNLWIGTNGGGLIYFNRKTGIFTRYKYNAHDNNSLSNDIIVSLCIDKDRKLWIGTYFGGLDCFDGKTFLHYRHNDKIPASISDDRVWSIFEDSSRRLWIGTLGGGLEIFDRSKKKFYHPFGKTDIRCPFISTIFEDKQGNIWVGGYFGIDVIIKKDNRVIHYNHDPNNANSLIGNDVNCITQDSRGLIWIGSREGVSIMNPVTKKFTSLTQMNGLPDNLILNILEDNNRDVWLSTSNGLCRVKLSPEKNGYKFHFENFDETDGLQGQEFNVNAALTTREGELIFGGAHGFNLFDPANIHPDNNKPKLIFTDFQLFNKSITANEALNGHVVLTKAISATREITLNHTENVFTIEFATIDFFSPNKIKHQYMLEGFDKGWVNADNRTLRASYTNLDQGDYVFKVRASDPEGEWNPDYISLKIKVLPPFWKSTFAYIIYSGLFIGILLLIRQRGIQKIRRQFAAEKEKEEAKLLIEQERQEVKRVQELDQLKIKFLTNVSHEFRTPLSLIMAPVEKMLARADLEQKQQLGMIGKNAKRLLNLVNQLLDFRKMEVQELKLHRKPGDILKFIKENVLSFTDIAEERKIKLLFDSDVDSLVTSFDHNKIERILFNLLSNAFKFTQPGGRISVLLHILCDESNPGSKLLEITIADTGIGIPIEKQERIFERFFQHDVPESLINQGSGIGLSITKEFVKMHNGEITVESEPDHGSCFKVRLPMPVSESLTAESAANEAAINEAKAIVSDEKNDALLQHADKNKKPLVLLVEDNDDFRFYLKDNLKDAYSIVEASNGQEGWQKALSQHPDIMVSDISMPEMNGIDLCKKIKSDIRTSSIPVILLTALTDEEAQLKGLGIGANDYITKPFNFLILISKIRNLLILQKTFKTTYKKQIDVQLTEISDLSEDEKFLRSTVDYIEQNILSYDLTVEDLSSQMNMSRVSLYKKLLSLTGKTPVEFIRSIRLKKAVQLMENSQMNISQICYEVGFNTPKYFAKSFKKEYNMLPSEYVNSLRKEKAAKIGEESQV